MPVRTPAPLSAPRPPVSLPWLPGKATEDWDADFLAFRNALPPTEVAAAIFNFEWWVDQDAKDKSTVLVSWRPEGLAARQVAQAGYYLGSLIAATDPYVERHLSIDSIQETYYEFCVHAMHLGATECNLERVQASRRVP